MTHFNKSSLPLFDDLLQALERKLRYCRRSFDCGFFEDHTSLEQQALVSGRKIEIFFPKIFWGAKRQVAPIRASTMKPICREDFAKSEHSGKSERCPRQRESLTARLNRRLAVKLSWLSCCGNWIERILPLDRYILG